MDENKRSLFVELKLLYVEMTVVLPSKNPEEAAKIFKIRTGYEYEKSRVAQIIDSATNIVDKYEKLVKYIVAIILIAVGFFAYLMPTSTSLPPPPPPPPPPPVPVPVPVPVPPFKPDPELENTNAKLSTLRLTAEKWRSRTGPIYENINGLLDHITPDEQGKIQGNPTAKENWNYLQSIQKIISSETGRIRSQDKNAIAINVDVTGVGDIGDRAAKQLNDWLESHRFNTNKNGSLIYITVTGKQESHFNDYTSHRDASTSLCVDARWLDGGLFFKSKIGPVPASAGESGEAEDRSLDAAVKEMISFFESHVY